MENIAVKVTGETMSQAEIDQYVARGREKYGAALTAIDIVADGEYVDLHYHLGQVPFDRIRRITGYLVGTLDRFNNAKRAEERDRVKHNVQNLA